MTAYYLYVYEKPALNAHCAESRNMLDLCAILYGGEYRELDDQFVYLTCVDLSHSNMLRRCACQTQYVWTAAEFIQRYGGATCAT